MNATGSRVARTRVTGIKNRLRVQAANRQSIRRCKTLRHDTTRCPSAERLVIIESRLSVRILIPQAVGVEKGRTGSDRVPVGKRSGNAHVIF